MPRILVIEDEIDQAKEIKKYLEKRGYIVNIAQSRENALNSLKKEGFDGVTLDLRLPEKEGEGEGEVSMGEDLLKEIREGYPDIAMIIVTVVANIQEAIKVMTMGADYYVTKPYDLSVLETTVKKWIEYRRAIKEKREAEKARLFALEEMSNALAHYIKNALAVILGSMGFIKSVVKDEKVGERIEKIEAKCEEIDGFVKRLHEVGYIKPVYRSVYIDEIIEVLISLLEDKIREQKVECEIDKESLSKKTIRVDYEYIKEAILNIITNSIEAMPDGGKLKIGGSFSDDFFELRIEDTGFGIFEKDLEEVFKLDFTTKPGWHGLGLPITKRIIEAHKGKIEIKSVVDKGTTCLVMLPIKEVKDV